VIVFSDGQLSFAKKTTDKPRGDRPDVSYTRVNLVPQQSACTKYVCQL